MPCHTCYSFVLHYIIAHRHVVRSATFSGYLLRRYRVTTSDTHIHTRHNFILHHTRHRIVLMPSYDTRQSMPYPSHTYFRCDCKFHLYKCRTHPSRSQYVFLGLGAANSGLPMQSPSEHRTSTETSRCLTKGDLGTCTPCGGEVWHGVTSGVSRETCTTHRHRRWGSTWHCIGRLVRETSKR